MRSKEEIEEIIKHAREDTRAYFRKYHKLPKQRKYRAAWAKQSRHKSIHFVIEGYVGNGTIEFTKVKLKNRLSATK